MLAAKRSGIPYLVTFHTGGHSIRHRNALRSTQWRLVGTLLRDAVSLVAVSHFEAATLRAQARLHGKNITVIRNGGTLPKPPAGVTTVPGRIVSSGRLERYKGHHRVIEALPYLMSRIPDAHLVILGHGPYERELHNLASELGVADRVTIAFLPPEDRTAMATALAEANVVAALSDYEATRGSHGSPERGAPSAWGIMLPGSRIWSTKDWSAESRLAHPLKMLPGNWRRPWHSTPQSILDDCPRGTRAPTNCRRFTEYRPARDQLAPCSPRRTPESWKSVSREHHRKPILDGGARSQQLPQR